MVTKKNYKYLHTSMATYIWLTPLLCWVLMSLKHKEILKNLNLTFIGKQIAFRHSSEEVLLLRLHGEFRVCDMSQIRISNLHFITGINHCENDKGFFYPSTTHKKRIIIHTVSWLMSDVSTNKTLQPANRLLKYTSYIILSWSVF